MTMEKFLSDCKNNLNNIDSFSKVHVVLGNESCDLDSAVSTIVMAYLLHELQPVGSVLVLPVLNVSKKDIKLRTEITFFFERVDISLDILVYRDDVDLKKLHAQNKLSLTLVDHNLLPKDDAELQCSVQEIIDHHRLETSHRCDKTVEMVGSCCTLIAEKALHSKPELIDPQVALLLYGTILLDTICLSESARKATPKDQTIISELQTLLPELTKEEVFKSLQTAKNDVSQLTLDELLRKDKKVVSTDTKKIAISSIPGDIKSMCQQNSVEGELGNFCRSHCYNAIIILSVKVEEKSSGVQRGLAVFSYDTLLKQQITSALMAVAEPCLELEMSGNATENFISFTQGNCQASRKVVLPVLRKFLLSLEDNILTKASDQAVTNGMPSKEHVQQLNVNSNASPDRTTFKDLPISPQNSTSSASETAKDGGTEKHDGLSLLAEHFSQVPSLYRAQTVDFPDCPQPQHTKHGQTRLGSVGIEDEADDDVLSRGDQLSISDMRQGSETCLEGKGSHQLSLASDIKYFEDSFVSGNLKIHDKKLSLFPDSFLSDRSSDIFIAAGDGEQDILQQSAYCGFQTPCSDKMSPLFSTPVRSGDDVAEKIKGLKADSSVFQEESSGSMSSVELVKKLTNSFVREKMKDYYILCGRLRDLYPMDANKILDTYSYSDNADGTSSEALCSAMSPGLWDHPADWSSQQNNEVVVSNVDSTQDNLSDTSTRAAFHLIQNTETEEKCMEEGRPERKNDNVTAKLRLIKPQISLNLESFGTSSSDISEMQDSSATCQDSQYGTLASGLSAASLCIRPTRVRSAKCSQGSAQERVPCEGGWQSQNLEKVQG